MLICWPRPSVNQVALNIDGSSYGNPGRAGVGGLIRDHKGKWIMGFNSHIKFATSLEAELLAILYGLRVTWELGYKDVCCRSDCVEALLMILHPISEPHKYTRIILSIREFMGRDWTISLNHTHRESNQCADFLAKAAANGRGGLKIISKPPDALSSILLTDAKGTPYQRDRV